MARTQAANPPPPNQTITFTPPGPVAAAFMNSRAKVSALVGPYGSGKTSTGIMTLLKCTAETVPDGDSVRRFRGVVIRSTYQMLLSSTIPTISRLLPASAGKLTMGSPIQKVIRAPGVDITLDLLALDQDADRRRIEGSTYNAAWLDEARETSWPIVQTILTRVRAVTDQGKPTPLRVIFTSNPSGKSHWLYQRFVEKPVEGWELFHQPSGLSPLAENLKYLSAGYYQDMQATSDPSFFRVHGLSEWGDTVIGAAVIPEFSPILHVAPEDMRPSPALPLILGIDAGPTLHPAAVIAQSVPMKTGGHQLRIYADWYAENLGAERAAHELRAYVQREFPEIPVGWASIDPSAAQQKDNATERFFLPIWKAITRWPIRPAPSNLLSIRIEGTRGLFTRLVGGAPAVWISPRCTNLIRALSGEYRFKQSVTPQGLATNETQIDKLNRPFADIGDAMTYLALGSGEFEILRNIGRKRGNAPRFAETDAAATSLFHFDEPKETRVAR